MRETFLLAQNTGSADVLTNTLSALGSLLPGLALTVLLFLLKTAYYHLKLDIARRTAAEQISRITGCWRVDVTRPNGEKYHEVIWLQQKGLKVTGYIDYISEPSGPAERPINKRFLLEGAYRERTLALVYRPQDKSVTSAGCIVGFMQKDHEFEGYCIYYDGMAGEVVPDKYLMKRSGA